LAIARDGDASSGADGDFACLLGAGPVVAALLKFVGTRNLWRLLATRRAVARDLAAIARRVDWREPFTLVEPERVAAWAERFSTCRVLAVSGRGFGRWRHMPEALARRVATAALGMRFLEALALHSCGLGSGGAAELAAALGAAALRERPRALRITALDLSRNSLDGISPEYAAEGAAPLLAALPALPALARLDLSDNSLNDWAASALAAVLPRLPALAELDLRGSNFSPQAQAELLKAAAGRRVAIAF
jgi:hypothetical protein